MRDLQGRGIEAHRITKILPDIADPEVTRYRFSRSDRHPTPRSYELIARYVVSEIID